MSRAVRLHAVLKTTALTAPLKSGLLASDRVTLEFTEIEPIHKAFAPMVREASFDLSELAVVTALQAVAYGCPVVLLPVVVASRFQRGCLIEYRPRGGLEPERLSGKRIGVRSYTQTTGMWVRAHLVEDYGLATPSIRWITRDPAHVAAYRDPPFVEHPAHDKGLLDMLHDGDIDAAIFGNDLPEGDDYRPLFENAQDRDESRQAATKDSPRKTLSGLDALRVPLAWIIDACVEQALLPRKLSLDEVLGPAQALLEGGPR